MTTLICGSIAYDTIMVFEGKFKDHILPDQVHILNVSFMVPQLRREYGGCAANIAYNLAQPSTTPALDATKFPVSNPGVWNESHWTRGVETPLFSWVWCRQMVARV